MRRVIDEVVRSNPKYPELSLTPEYVQKYSSDITTVSDKFVQTTLSKKQVGYKISLIDTVISEYNRLQYDVEYGTLELPTGPGSLPISTIKFMKALLINCVSANEVFANACRDMFQHVLRQAVSNEKVSAVDTGNSVTLENVVLQELSDFYIKVVA